MQDRCIFGFISSGAFEEECGPAAKALNATVFNQMKTFFPKCNVTSKGVHVLFNWNAHSLFTYHKDPNSIITVIVQLTPGKTDFHVAGKAQLAVYETAGSAHMFCSQAWHRSGTAQRRTIKVAYFYDVDVIDLDKGDVKQPTVATVDTDRDIKPTVGGCKSVPSQHAASSSADAEAAVPAEEGDSSDSVKGEHTAGADDAEAVEPPAEE